MVMNGACVAGGPIRPGRAARRPGRATALCAAGQVQAAAGDGKRSGYEEASQETRAMQDDDPFNPAFLWVAQGETLWSQPAAAAGKSCADCHGDVARSMRG